MTLKPPASAAAWTSLATLEPNSVFSLRMAMVSIFLPFAFMSLRNWIWSLANDESLGLARKKYLKPALVSVGDDASEQTYGVCRRSAAWLAVLVTELW